MLLKLTICQLFVLTLANPFHKYPFVFLLDVGNEELEKTNTEQIRISTPGGSVALRYPAVGDGDTIAHVRVSGIDFGTDLKANIVDGGPGYKYVVLVFMGNRGVPYDAVITVQTIPKEKNGYSDTSNNEINDNNEETDLNDSAEDLGEDSVEEKDSPSEVKSYAEKSNAELTQSSSNIYRYAQNEVSDSRDYEVGDDDDSDDATSDDHAKANIHSQYSGNNEQDVQMNDYSDNYENQGNVNDRPQAEKYSAENDDDSENDDDNEAHSDDDQSESVDDRHESVDTYLTEYSQEKSVRPISSPEYLDYEDSEELDQMFNDEDDHSEVENDKDSNNNNNYIDSEDGLSIAY